MAGMQRNPKYVYDLPYFERMELCRILDHNDKWEELAGVYMNFDMMTIQILRKETLRGNSPTDELLTKWGHQNHTILELFVLLSKMQHYQAMLVLKQFVDAEYHRLIYEGEQNLSRIFKSKPNSNAGVPSTSNQSATLLADGAHAQDKNMIFDDAVNMNFSKSSNVLPEKVSFSVHNDGNQVERKILNVDDLQFSQRQTLKESNSRKTNAPTVLVNRMENAVALDPSDLKPKSSKAESCKDKNLSEISSIAESVGILPVITFKELEIATNGWDPSTILGKGGFGTVYKGTWKNTQVAIKRTKNPETDENHTVQIQQILGELKMLNSYRHDNILPLYGFSMGGEDPCLIYQYMPNGSLEDRLLCRQGTKPLTWFQRHNVATGTARGLQFLHTIGEKPLIHGDIKSANILLDSNFEPKIGDFGLAREGPYNHYTHMKVSKVHGTRPYLPDEFLRHKKFSTKVDTHSFGIVLFELATGLRAYDEQRSHKFLKDLVESSNETQLANLVDKKCGRDEQQTFSNLIALGKCCVSRKPKDRPEMVLVLQELNAMAVQRDMLAKVQSMIRQNSLTPSNPYEMQALHDHLSQQRKISPSFSPSHSPDDSHNANHNRNHNSPFLEMKHLRNDNVGNGKGEETNDDNNNSLEAIDDLSSAKNGNTGIVPPHILERIARESPRVMPSISVSPPSASRSETSASISTREEPDRDADYQFMSQFDDFLPLISELGIKAKTENGRQQDENGGKENVSETGAAAAAAADNVSTTAKGKALWILGD